MADCSKTEIFLKEWARMYRSCTRDVDDCTQCLMYDIERVWDNIDEAIKMTQQWSDEHPIKTRQSEFLKIFPNAKINNYGTLAICPVMIDTTINCDQKNCYNCEKEYWNTEVE